VLPDKLDKYLLTGLQKPTEGLTANLRKLLRASSGLIGL
jgi:hypothetical protein